VICFGLHGGIGNCLFCLPAIKALTESGAEIELYVEGDYPMIDLWSRCRYASRVRDTGAVYRNTLCGQYWPHVPGVHWRRLGWPDGQSSYPKPEWQQILDNAPCPRRRIRVDVRDWIDVDREPRYDVGLIPGCKPGGEWSRKRWPYMHVLAEHLEKRGLSVRAFGLDDEIREAHLRRWHGGRRSLDEMPEELATARVIVGTDSGITQLASSIGLPTVMLFTATCPTKGDPVGPPALNRKLTRALDCAPCQSTPRWRECIDWRCREIHPGNVLDAVDDLLDGDTPHDSGRLGPRNTELVPLRICKEMP
jgi:ADP-heptose:LPS heptosyltransferase